jgi:hypothetical protein
MRERDRLGFWVGMLLCGIAACGQELMLPKGDPGKADGGAGRPTDGLTGASGAPGEAPPNNRLPVVDKPVFTTFGGAGGDDSSAAVGTGGTKPVGGATGSGGIVTAREGGAGGASGAEAVTSGPRPLFFSEYVEGSGSFKALEIFASQAASLEGCELQTYFNGKLEPSRVALHGELAKGTVQVLCSPALASVEPAACARSTSLTFNGDDALALSCDGVLLDIIGQIGVDPGDSWGAGATADHTLQRRCSVISGRSDPAQPFEIDTEWLTFGVDTFSNLGRRSCDVP